MDKWVSVKEGLPNTETECVVAAREHDLIYTHKVFVQWDGYRWVDAEGEEVKDVVAWMKAPQFLFNSTILRVIQKMESCIDHDTCENEKCCYFAHPGDMTEVLEYIKKMEGIS